LTNQKNERYNYLKMEKDRADYVLKVIMLIMLALPVILLYIRVKSC
jgi:hypothetical protein